MRRAWCFSMKKAKQFLLTGVHGVEAAEYPVLCRRRLQFSFARPGRPLRDRPFPWWPACRPCKRLPRCVQQVGNFPDEFLVGLVVIAEPGEFAVFLPVDALQPAVLGQDLLQSGQDLSAPRGGRRGNRRSAGCRTSRPGTRRARFRRPRGPLPGRPGSVDAGEVELEKRFEECFDREQWPGEKSCLACRDNSWRRKNPKRLLGKTTAVAERSLPSRFSSTRCAGPVDQVLLEADQLEHGTSSTSPRSM